MIRRVTQHVTRKTRDPYHHERGVRTTIWLLFIPIYSSTTWEGR